MNNKAKEAIEEDLLAAMRNLDSAKFIINSNEDSEEEYATDFNEIAQAKVLIKRALNRSFDFCARKKESV